MRIVYFIIISTFTFKISKNQGLTNSLANEIATRVKVSGHNIGKITKPSRTGLTGLDFTVNSDGSVKVNGTSTAAWSFIMNDAMLLKAGSYTLSSGIGANPNLYVQVTNADQSVSIAMTANSAEKTFTLNVDTIVVYRLFYLSGQTFNNVVVYPMIRLATDESADYVPYSMTNRELTDNYSKTTVRVISVKNTSGTWGDSIKNVLDAFRALTDIPDSDKVYIYDLQLSYMHLNVINAEYREFSSVRSSVKTYNCVGSNNNPKHILNAKIIDSGSSVELNRFSFEDSSLTNISTYTSQGSTSIHFLQLHNV